MGMFDYVKVDYPLPDGWVPDDELQTKDFDCVMTTVWITAEGRILIEDFEYETIPEDERPFPNDTGILKLAGSIRKINRDWRDLNYHGWMEFYGYEKGPSGIMRDGKFIDENGIDLSPVIWHEYKAKFTDGNLVEILVVEQ